MAFFAGLLLIIFIIVSGSMIFKAMSDSGKSIGLSAAIGGAGGALFFILFLLVNEQQFRGHNT